jgi:ESF2/ABP1 family protein
MHLSDTRHFCHRDQRGYLRIAYEKASRLQRLRAEISQARRENKDYVHKVERAKMIRSIEKRRKRRHDAEEDEVRE